MSIVSNNITGYAFFVPAPVSLSCYKPLFFHKTLDVIKLSYLFGTLSLLTVEHHFSKSQKTIVIVVYKCLILKID